MAVESLEQRMALTAAPGIGLAVASDSGIRGDGITRFGRPTFAGAAPALSNVVVYADNQLLGVTKATPVGAWSLPTPVTRLPLTAGAHTLTAYAVGPDQVWSTPTAVQVTIDPTPPKIASLVYDKVNGRATVTFSEPVSGVRSSNLVLSAQTQSGITFANVPITDSRAQFFVGSITLSQSPDGKTVTFQEQLTLAEPGTFTLSFLRTGVTDKAGNLLAAGAATRFTII
jgi:hypothetical protein